MEFEQPPFADESELQALMNAYLRDEATDEQMLRLAELVQQDRACAERVITDAMIAGWFRAEGNPAFVTESVLLATRNRDTQFVRSVMNRLAQPSQAIPVAPRREAGSESTGPVKPITRRVARVATGRHESVGEHASTSASGRSQKAAAPARSDRWNWVFGAGMAALFALYIFGRIMVPFGEDRITPVARITFIGSTGFIERDGRLLLVQAETPVGDGDIVRTGDISVLGGRGLQFVFQDEEGTIVSLAENSSVKVTVDARGKRLDVLKGKLSAAVEPQPEGKPMRLATGQAEIKVIGTRFSLEDGGSTTRLEVQEGTVELKRRADGESMEVPRGFFVDADAKPSEPLQLTKSLEVPDGLLARWTFDEGKGQSSRDVTASGRAVALYGTEWTEGRDNSGLSFDGVSAYADFGSTPDLNFPAGQPFSYTGWFKSTDDFGSLVSQRHDQDEGAVIDIAIGNHGGGRRAGCLMALIRQNGMVRPPYTQVTGPKVNDGAWHHFVVTRDSNGILELFLDGASCGTGRGVGGAGPINTNLRAFGDERYWVLKSGVGLSARLKGTLDDIRIYNRVLTADEVKQLAK